MQINVTYDASVNSAPAGFKAAVQAAVQFFETTITSPISVNIQFGYGEVDGQAIDPSAVSESVSAGFLFSYAQVVAALTASASSADQVAAVASLPTLDPTGGGEFFVAAAEAQALGLYQGDTSLPDGYVGLSSTAAFTFDPNNRAVAGEYDAVGAIEHEISEVLGRLDILGQQQSDGSTVYSPLDLFRYSSSGVRALSPGPADFSVNGQQLLFPFNNSAQNGGDPGDWGSSVVGDSFDAFIQPGVEDSVSATDLRVLNVLGYSLAPPMTGAPPTPTPAVGATSNTAITQNTTILQGQSVYVTSGGAFTIDGVGSGSAPSLTNSGTITVIAANGGDVPVGVDDGDTNFFDGSTFTNTSTGQVFVESTGSEGVARGFEGGSQSSAVDNAGLIQVVSLSTAAVGVSNEAYPVFTNETTGRLVVWSAFEAVGVDMGGGLSNAGVISVTGATAIGVQTGDVFNNSGTITATNTGAWGSIAVDVVPNSGQFVFDNTGRIQGDYAFFVDSSQTSPPFAPPMDIVNGGVIVGASDLGGGPAQVHNTGAIDGPIIFGDSNSIYDGASGRQAGEIYLGAAVNSVALGNDGEVVFGGGVADTITGGAGNDFIGIARGANVINGGGGFNTLSFADSAAQVSVDLGAGTASAAGTDTIQNIQSVIASDFTSTLKAGAAAATLVGGAAYDTLIGGAGGDTLISGTGGGLFTGGGGDNTFVYAAGDHQVVITDFEAAGTQNSLRVYGYAQPQSVEQQGLNTLITLSSDDSILLDNVQASSLNAENVTYSASAPPSGENLAPAPPVFGTTGIYVDYNLKVFASETFNEAITSANPFALFDGTNPAYPRLAALASIDNFGDINVVSQTTTPAIGVYCDPTVPKGGVFTNEAGATFSVSATEQAATGLSAEDWSPNVVNGGLFTVTSSGYDFPAAAEGINTYDPQFQFTNTASGVFNVQGQGDAIGVNLQNGGTFENDGALTVTSSEATATGLRSDNGSGSATITNTGVITVTGAGAASSVGIAVGGLYLTIKPTIINNSGTITAQTAIEDFGDGNSAFQDPLVELTNSGRINGDIDLGGPTSSIINTGTIVGNIFLQDDGMAPQIAAGDTVDLRGGAFTGYVSITPGTQNGGAPVHDVIYTGAGSTLVKIAAGEPQLTATITGAAAGQTTVLILEASTSATWTQNADGSWTVAAGAAGTETLVNVQHLQFTDKTVSLVASPPTPPSDFLGDGKSDLLIENGGGAVVVGEVGANDQAAYTQVGALGPEWSLHGTGDFLGDGKSDFLLENTAGAVFVAEVASGSAAYTQVGALGAEWTFRGTGDFLGDGKSDFLIENTAGAVDVGEVGSNGQAAYTQVGALGSEWTFKGAGDFLGDGKSDFLIENTAGAVFVGEIGAGGQTAYTQVASLGAEWKFVGTGDFLGEGHDQFLIENTAGAVDVGDYVNGQIHYTQVAALGSEWTFVGTGDYLGEGHDQFLIENTAGAVDVGDYVNGQIHYTQVAALGSEWIFHG